MKELNEVNTEQEEVINKELIYKYLSRWYWFIFFGVLGMGIGYKMDVFIQPEYEIRSSLIPRENSGEMTNLFSIDMLRSRANIQNHIEILKSNYLNHKALENLDWKVFWYKRNLFITEDLYQSAPFKITLYDDFLNLRNIPIKITAVSEKEYQLSVDKEAFVNGKKELIQFEQKNRFGNPFRNRFFHFIVERVPGQKDDPESEYFFSFKDLDQLTMVYQTKLDIYLVNAEADLIRLNIRGNQPAREASFLNELCNVYIRYDLQKKNQVSENTIQFINFQLQGLVDSLQMSGRSYTNFRSRNRIVDLSQEGGLVVQRLEELESEESIAKMRFEYYQNLIKYVGDAKQMEKVITPSVVGITDPTLNGLVTRLTELYTRRNTLSYSAKETFPGLISINNEITQTMQMLNENLKNLINNVKIELQNILDRKSEINTQLSRLPKTEQDYINVKREFDINNELYTFMLEKRAEAAITRASNVSDIQILDRARVERAIQIGPKTTRDALVGLILGLLIPITIITSVYYFSTTITKTEEVEKQVDNSIVGKIYHSQEKLGLPVLTDPQSAISESFRQLRTNLMYMLYDEKQKVIAVHSSIPKEGKSFVAGNLALIFSLNKTKVLLVDADLRKPSLKTFFDDEKSDKGLCTFLIGKNIFKTIVHKGPTENLDIVFAGPVPPNPSELLGNQKFEKFLEQAKQQYDVIIIDNAPMFVVTDGTIIGSKADINLFIIRMGYSNKEQLNVIKQTEKQGLIKRLVYVLNDVKESSLETYKQYGGKYGYYHNDESKSLFEKLTKLFK